MATRLNDILDLAVDSSAINTVKAVIKDAEKINVDLDMSKAIRQAVKRGCVEILRILFNNGANFTNDPDLPILAVRSKNAETLNFILNICDGIDVMDEFGRTPLMCASNNEEISRLLIEKGVDVNISSCNNFTALMSAIAHSNFPVTKLLVENGADIFAHYEGKDAIEFAASLRANRNPKIIRFLLDEMYPTSTPAL